MNEPAYISLHQLLLSVQQRLRTGFPEACWVKAEVAGIRYSGRHVYFDLIEIESGITRAKIKACAFDGEGTAAIQQFKRITGQAFGNGMKVGVKVRVQFHPVFGLSLVLCELDAALALGGIELARKQTLQRLLDDRPDILSFAEGIYLTPNKKLRPPPAFGHVALVTSDTSDAYKDFMHTIRYNEHGYKIKIDIYNALVHGNNAAGSLLTAFSRIRATGRLYDAVALCRGGGAPADFLPFDEYALALEIATMPIPVITGIGHQMNQGIADFFACVHTKTPTMAAGFIIERNRQFEQSILKLSHQLSRNAARILAVRTGDLLHVKKNIFPTAQKYAAARRSQVQMTRSLLTPALKHAFAHASAALRERRHHLVTVSREALLENQKTLSRVVTTLSLLPLRQVRMAKRDISAKSGQVKNILPPLLRRHHTDMDRWKESFKNLAPDTVLKRGFALLKKGDRLVADTSGIVAGDEIQIISYHHVLNARINDKTQRNGKESDL